jgi:outer membrane immunogenic protein
LVATRCLKLPAAAIGLRRWRDACRLRMTVRHPETGIAMNSLKWLALSAAAMTIAGPAIAQKTTGLRIEVTSGYDAFSSHDTFGDLPDTLDGARIGGAIGYDVAVTGRLLLGVEAGIGWSLGDHRTAPLGSDRLVLSTGRDLDFSVRAGLPIAGRTIGYIKAGYANSRVKLRYEAKIANGYDVERSAANGDGLRLGAGIEHPLAGRTYVKAEYRWTRYYGKYAYQQRPTRNQLLLGAGVRF